MTKKDDGFRDFIVHDQLGELGVESRAMFGGYGLYYQARFFGIIHKSRLFFKTNSETRVKYLDAQSKPFQPNPKQTLKNYYEVPTNLIEDPEKLMNWTLEASRIP